MSLENQNLPHEVQRLRVDTRVIAYLPGFLAVAASNSYGYPTGDPEIAKRNLRRHKARYFFPQGISPDDVNLLDLGQEALIVEKPELPSEAREVNKIFMTNPDVLDERLSDLTESAAVYDHLYPGIAVPSTERIGSVPKGLEAFFGTDVAVTQTMTELNITGNALKTLKDHPEFFAKHTELIEPMQQIADGTRKIMSDKKRLWTPDLSRTHNNVVIATDEEGNFGISIIDKSPFNAHGGNIRPTAPIYDRRASGLPDHIEESLDLVHQLISDSY